jgi:hypothetical protein
MYSKLVETAYRSTILAYRRRLKKIWKGRRQLRDKIERLQARFERYKKRGYKVSDIRFALKYWRGVKGAGRFVSILEKILKRLERERLKRLRRPPKKLPKRPPKRPPKKPPKRPPKKPPKKPKRPPKKPKPAEIPPPEEVPPPEEEVELARFLLVKSQQRDLVNVRIIEREYGVYEFEAIRDILRDCVESGFLTDGVVFYVVGIYLCFSLREFDNDVGEFEAFVEETDEWLREVIIEQDVEGFEEFRRARERYIEYINSHAIEFLEGRMEDIVKLLKRTLERPVLEIYGCDVVLWMGFTIRIHQEKQEK